jgi:predicted sulfurtransferase
MGELATRLKAVGSGELAAVQLNVGDVVDGSTRPFRKRVVKARAQVLTDGLASPLDWARSGVDVPPEEWDEALREEGALLLDCRNAYESEVGSFVVPASGGRAEEPAEPLDTEVFAESWDVLRERLAAVPKDTPILTYCTGGIRCVKVNAFLEQEMGFGNTKKLRDGIIGYMRHKEEAAAQEAAAAAHAAAHDGAAPAADGAVARVGAWRGANFVFDERTTVMPRRAAHDEGDEGDEGDEPGQQ